MRKFNYCLLLLVVIVFLTGCKASLSSSHSEGNSGGETVSSEHVSETDEAVAENTGTEREFEPSSAVSEKPDGAEESSQQNAVSEKPEESLQQNDASEKPEGSDTNPQQNDVKETSQEDASQNQAQNSSEQPKEETLENKPEEPKFTVEEFYAVLFVKKAVNVRIGPSTDYEKVGTLAKGEQIQVTGIADTGWYRITYNDSVAYVSSNYLMDEASYVAMVEEEARQAAEEAARQAAEEAARQEAAQQAQQQASQQQPSQEQPAQPEVSQPVNSGDIRSQVVAIMNQERAAAGVGAISQNASLDALAQIRAQEIVTSFSHTRPNGSSCFTVFDGSGISYSTAGENIAAGYGTPAEVMAGWMSSEGHRANILNGAFGQVGIGYYYDPSTPYGTYWVQVFTN